MVTGTGEEPHRGPGVAAPAQPAPAQPAPAQAVPAQPAPAQAVPTEAAPDAVPPVHGRAGAERVRRPADLLLAVFAFVVVALVLSTIRTLPLGSTEAADDVSRWLLHIPRWLAYAAAVVAGVASFVLAVASLVVLVRNQWRDALNAVVAGLVGAAAAVVATVIWRIENATVERAVLHGSNPSIFIVDTAFVAFVVGTDLSRLSHWQRWWPRASAALLLSGLAVGTLTPFAVVIVASGGLLFGWVVRWLLGAASVLPGITELTGWLTSQRVQATDLSVAGPSRARLEGKLADGTRIRVHLSGRDTRGSGLARRLWALARLRPAVAGHIALSSRAQVQQLALACFLAQQAGVASPAVRLLGEMPGETLVLVTTIPDSGPETGATQLAGATSLFAALRRLHDTGVAHHDVRAGNVFMSGNRAGFCSLDAAEPGCQRTRPPPRPGAGPGDAGGDLRAGRRRRGAAGRLRAGGPGRRRGRGAAGRPRAVGLAGRAGRHAARSSEIRHQLLGDDDAAPPPSSWNASAGGPWSPRSPSPSPPTCSSARSPASTSSAR